jgi:hypothetical protein
LLISTVIVSVPSIGSSTLGLPGERIVPQSSTQEETFSLISAVL